MRPKKLTTVCHHHIWLWSRHAISLIGSQVLKLLTACTLQATLQAVSGEPRCTCMVDQKEPNSIIHIFSENKLNGAEKDDCTCRVQLHCKCTITPKARLWCFSGYKYESPHKNFRQLFTFLIVHRSATLSIFFCIKKESIRTNSAFTQVMAS